MSQKAKRPRLNIIHTLTQIYRAQELLDVESLEGAADIDRMKELDLAIAAASSVISIYVGMGHEPTVVLKHFTAIDMLEKALEGSDVLTLMPR